MSKVQRGNPEVIRNGHQLWYLYFIIPNLRDEMYVSMERSLVSESITLVQEEKIPMKVP